MQKPARAVHSTIYRLLLLLLLSSPGICLPGIAQEASPFRIAFLTDIHVSPHSLSEANLGKIVAEINAGPYDFAVVTGDLTNTGLDSLIEGSILQYKKL